MNQDNDKHEAMDVDPQVSAHYEKFANEKTPANLDQAVLHEARRAVRADNRSGSFGAWFRPVAFMATVGLSLAIILDLSDTSFFSPPADMSFEIASPAAVKVPDETATEAAGTNRSQMTPSEVMRRKKSISAQSLTVDVPVKTRPEAESFADDAVVSDVFTAEVESAEQRVQKIEANPGANQQSQPAAAAKFTESQPAIASQPLSIMNPAACSDEQKSTVEEWWKCIETLRQSGLTEAADRELENLRENFPDFETSE